MFKEIIEKVKAKWAAFKALFKRRNKGVLVPIEQYEKALVILKKAGVPAKSMQNKPYFNWGSFLLGAAAIIVFLIIGNALAG